LEGLAMPVTVFVKEENGKTGTVNLPAEIWQRGGTWTFQYKSSSKIDYAIIDPDHVLPDINPENNGYSGISIAKDVTAATVIKAYLNAVGGEEKLKDIKDLTVSSEGTVQGLNVIRVNQYKGQGKFHQEITVPVYNMSAYHVVINDDSLNIKQMNRAVPIAKDAKASVEARYKLFPELEFGKSGYSAQLDPSLKVVNGQLAYLVTVTAPNGVRVKYFYDMKTGLKVKQFTDVPGSTVMEFGDYQNIETGIKIPFSEKTNIVGQPIEFKVKSSKVNSGLGDDQFK
jgi:hypothetical protein